MLRLAFDFIITWRETRTRPNAYKKIKLLGILMTVSFLCCYAQTKEFDPSLAPNVTIVSRQSQEEWNSRYMWYPGQLAAFYQQQCARISKERCVNVSG